MRIGIIVAMDTERQQLERVLGNVSRMEKGLYVYTVGRIGQNEIVLMQCGIGKVNAAIGSTELLRFFQPDCVISTGVAGGIDSSLGLMDVVAARRTVYHDVWCGGDNDYGQVQGLPTFFSSNDTLYNLAVSLSDDHTAIKGGLICTGDKFISERTELDAIKKRFPEGLAVDMESCAIAQVCYRFKVPFLSFRIISDTPNEESKARFNQYLNFWEEMASRSFQVTRTFLESIPAHF